MGPILGAIHCLHSIPGSPIKSTSEGSSLPAAFERGPCVCSALEQLTHLHLLSLADIGVPDVSTAAPAVTEAVAKTDGGGPVDGLAHIFEGMLTVRSSPLCYNYEW
jgi:hypothetical protein